MGGRMRKSKVLGRYVRGSILSEWVAHGGLMERDDKQDWIESRIYLNEDQ